MADTANTADGKPDAEKPAQTPPWGEDFDAEKAWRLIQNLRADKDGLTEKVDSLTTELQESQKTAETATEKLTAAEKARDEATHGLSIQKALRAHPDLEGYEEFLTGEDEEAILAKAARLSKIGAKDDEDDPKPDGEKPPKGDDDDDDDSDLPGRPNPSLKPGHGGDSPAPFDAEALAREARESGRY